MNHTVGTAEELYQVLAQGGEITVNGTLAGLQAFTLPAGSILKGNDGSVLKFKAGQPGTSLAADTRLENLRVETDAALIAVGLEDAHADLGRIAVSGITTVGRFHLEATQALRADIALRGIHVEQADAQHDADTQRNGWLAIAQNLGLYAERHYAAAPFEVGEKNPND